MKHTLSSSQKTTAPSVNAQPPFHDRREAGRQLGEALRAYDGDEVVVCALPRGGAVTGDEVAHTLRAPLHLVTVRKVGHPSFPEYAVAAVGEEGEPVFSGEESANVDETWLKGAINFARTEAKRRRELYLRGIHPPSLQGRVAIVVDDGLATGLTVKAAIREIVQQRPRRIIVAAPVGPKAVVKELSKLVDVDKVLVLHIPSGYFGAIGSYYKEFPQVTDGQVVAIMKGMRP